MSATNEDQRIAPKAESTSPEIQRLLMQIGEIKVQAEEQFRAAELARKSADSEGLFAFNAKKACEEHATIISQLKGSVESEVNTIKSNKQKSDELLAALTTGKAIIDADAKTIGDRRKEAELAAVSTATANANCAVCVQELDKSKVSAEEVLRAIAESREAANQAQKSAGTAHEEIAVCSVDAKNKVKQIVEYHATSNERCLAIKQALEDAQTSEKELESVLEHLKKSDATSTGHEIRVAKLTEDLELLIQRVDKLLPGATSASLASSFSAQKLRFAGPQKRWLTIFIGCILGLVVVALPSFIAALGMPMLGHSANATSNEIWRGLLLRMPIVIPLV